MNAVEFVPAIAAVIKKDNRFLIAKRKRAFMGSSWEFPRGKAENDESFQKCLKRELRKTFGIVVEVGDFLCAHKHIINCQSAINLYAYKVSHVSGEFRLKDHEEVQWVTLEELENYNFPDADRTIVRFLLNRL